MKIKDRRSEKDVIIVQRETRQVKRQGETTKK